MSEPRTRPPVRPLDRSLDRSRRLLRRWRRRVLLHRRLLAALAAGGAVLAVVQATGPPAPPSAVAWTAQHDLPGGSTLSRGDLVATRLAPETVPDGAVEDTGTAVGRTLAAPMSRGEVLTRTRLLGDGLLAGYPGTTAVPVRVSDAAVVDLLRVGDRVGLVLADPDGRRGAEVLVDDLPVVAIPEVRSSGLGAPTPGRLVVVAVPREEAPRIAAGAATSVLVPVWTR